jgi:hypothetical protein
MLYPKKYSIHNDYYISDVRIGQGSGYCVVKCEHKLTKKEYAFKVHLNRY